MRSFRGSCALALIGIAFTRGAAAQESATTQPAAKPAPASAFDLGYSQEQPKREGPAGEETATQQPEGFWIFNRPTQVGPMSSDRPGFSDSYSLVPRGYSHLEFGYTFTYDHERSTRLANHTIGEFSLRTGLLENFELRVKWTGMSLTASHFEDVSPWAGRHITREDHDDGATDMSVGFKSPLLKQQGLMPNLSIIPAISIPVGSDSKSTGDVDPEVRLAWNYALTDKWTVYGVGLATWISDGDGRFFQSGASLATYYQFTSNLGGFVEYYGLYPSTRGSDCQHNINFGPVILIEDNFQIDVRAGFGLNEEAPDFFTGIGFCWRF
ncbi:MAG: transporter [Phycisphaerales bacterium]|nr:transporter [Phycisphaerales bacterium]